MTNTKARHQEILAAAVEVIKRVGGVEAIDDLPQAEHKAILKSMALHVSNVTDCSMNAARNNITQALRKERHLHNDGNWGGPRPNQTGRPPLPEDEKRQRVSTKLAPCSKELAQAIAKILELQGWGHAVDLALVRLVENDASLKTKLAEMGIII